MERTDPIRQLCREIQRLRQRATLAAEQMMLARWQLRQSLVERQALRSWRREIGQEIAGQPERRAGRDTFGA